MRWVHIVLGNSIGDEDREVKEWTACEGNEIEGDIRLLVSPSLSLPFVETWHEKRVFHLLWCLLSLSRCLLSFSRCLPLGTHFLRSDSITFCLSLMDPFPSMAILVWVCSWSHFRDCPRGPSNLPMKLNCWEEALSDKQLPKMVTVTQETTITTVI